MAESSSSSSQNTPIELERIEDQLKLPLRLVKSEIIPPYPNRSSDSSIDWLHDFSSLSWIAYGASSLLVISHFPSPLSSEQTLIGPVYRQVIELSKDESSVVKAVAWSPVIPSEGEVAVAIENCICLYSEISRTTGGIFCWIQIAVLVHSYAVESMKWTGSGDGIISVGHEVVLWKRKSKTWEIAWKFKAEVPQSLASATWSTQGPVATAIHSHGSSCMDKEARCVLVCKKDGKYGLVKAELRHPQPVSMIQWRPYTGRHSQRDVLLTCCLDGTVRLWSEIDSGRAKKLGKEINEHKSTRQLFHVIAVIEINQAIDGNLGTNTFVGWAAETKNVVNRGEGIKRCFSTEGPEHDTPGRCEWLVGFGPGKSLTFWAIHCLDDISPLRFPRVTLWKRSHLLGLEDNFLQGSDTSNTKYQSPFVKATISRSLSFSSPITCSLFQLSDNSMSWSELSLESSTTKSELLTLDGHTGNIIQVAVHPYNYEVELVASLDSNGLLLIWSLSTISNCMLGMPALVLPTWKLLGKVVNDHLSSTKYSSLRWAPSVLEDNSVLLMGHAGGVDCFMIKISEVGAEKVLRHKLCTISFSSHCHVDGPTSIFAIPLPSTCRKTLMPNTFMLLGVWMKDFQALAWNVTFHPDDICGSFRDCVSGDEALVDYSTWKNEFILDGRRYSVVAVPCSSKFPDPHNHDHITSVAVVSPGSMTPSTQQNRVPSGSLSSPAYHMATGSSDGNLKLWRSTHAKSGSKSEMDYLLWELVGAFQAHQGPVSAIALSCCGRKIATICTKNNLDSVSALCIWETVNIRGEGNFLLEDRISLDGDVIAINWLSIGNGQLLLGVCMQHELRIYANRTYNRKNVVKSGKTLESNMWSCVGFGYTSLAAQDFLWGSGATPVLVHGSCFSLFSKWAFHTDKIHQGKFYTECAEDDGQRTIGGTEKDLFCDVFTDCKICDINELTLDEKTENRGLLQPSKINMKSDHSISNLCSRVTRHQYGSSMERGCWNMVEVAEKLCGSLPIYHPEALLMNLNSGNWRRSCVAVRHLVENLTFCESATNEKTCYSRRPNHIPQIELSKYFEEPSSASLDHNGSGLSKDSSFDMSATQFQRNSNEFIRYNSHANDSSNISTSASRKSEMSGFIEIIEKSLDMKTVTGMDRMQMLAVLDLLSEVSDSHSASAYESLDEPGRRFWVAVRFQQLNFRRRFGRLVTMDEFVVDSELMGWAFHSDCQDSIFSSFLSTEPSWKEMRNLGVGYWFTNATQLHTRMEKLARTQYLKRKDPKDCALLYIALNRLQVLAGLFKISKDEKDKPLVGFLSRNFQDEKNKAAALKNAYVLMGRHQLDLAAAFFLLGGDTSSSVSVCAKNLGDPQLGLVICRLIEGYGGPLENHLISKFLLPAATEKGDYWLQSFLEWTLGNYSESFLKLLGLHMDSFTNKLVLSSNKAAFLDPTVGQYALVLATKNLMKNSVGEFTAATFARWATLVTSIALDRCGLPLEALEYLSSSSSALEGRDERSVSDVRVREVLQPIFGSNPSEASNWLSVDVAMHLESQYKLGLALQYISTLTVEHPSWPDTRLTSCGLLVCKEYGSSQHELALQTFQHKLNVGLRIFEQKYSINSIDLLNMLFVYSSNSGLLFTGYHILHGCSFGEPQHDENHAFQSIFLSPPTAKLILKATEEISCLFARYLVVCSMLCSPPVSSSHVYNAFVNDRFHYLHAWEVYVHALVHAVKSLGAIVKMYFPGFLEETLIVEACIALDLIENFVFLASAWLQKNLKVLILIIHPIFVAYTDGHAPSEINMGNLKKHLYQNVELMIHDSLSGSERASVAICEQWNHEQSGEKIPEEGRWLIIGACLWRFLLNFANVQLKSTSKSIADESSSSKYSVKLNDASFESDRNSIVKLFQQVPVFLSKFLKNTLTCVSSSHVNELGSFLCQKIEKGFLMSTLSWLEDSNKSRPTTPCSRLQGMDSLRLMNDENGVSLLEVLWELCADPKAIREGFSQEKISCSQFITPKSLKVWTDIENDLMGESENGDLKVNGQGSSFSNSSASDGNRLPGGRRLEENHSNLSSKQRSSTTIKEISCFKDPEDIYKRNGELLEAMCINSLNQQEVALASNRKGILFFNRRDEELSGYQSEYIWSNADWPHNGWAGSESTPMPTFVSPGFGLGSKKGSHLGLGGATVGLGSSARPGRDLTGGGVFGIPGYAGIGASGLSWGIQEDFDESVDPPATTDNISTRALSSHPSRPFFLAGSSNTHVYLWKFGNEKATATYGVLPAANVPPPYALASISALQFDCYGHRFATAALDGTICTWQLEVGGRSNIRPTESSLCFKNNASDLTYVAGSGSVIAAAGYSSNDVNVVIWDTLAPGTTSQASLICHEGGARSVSVFDNDIGSGSISPLIVTGGKGGDIGLHDFRFIATGKTKRQRHPSTSEHEISSGISNKHGEQNSKGMLWYIPKAHLGSITKIATIPNTSLFLTGSKDGDVKLWDAKRAELVFHWPKLHERHTFLQPSSRGFGGVVRAAVTDIQVLSDGFLSCGGDGTLKKIQLKDFHHKT